MKREEIHILAQLLTAIQDSIVKMEEAQTNQDAEKMAAAKKEVMYLQKKIDEML